VAATYARRPSANKQRTTKQPTHIRKPTQPQHPKHHSVPKLALDDVFLEKEAIASSIKDELTKSMSVFGFRILQALVNDIRPAAKVKEAMNEINAAQRLRVAALEKAEAQKVGLAGGGFLWRRPLVWQRVRLPALPPPLLHTTKAR
jgi:hypothetical protein